MIKRICKINIYKILIILNILILFISSTYLFSEEKKISPAEIKSALLIKIANLIYWPENRKNFFNVCVKNDKEISASLKAFSSTSEINGKKIKVYENIDLNYLQDCDILFISEYEKNNISTIIAKTKEKPICTFGDSEGFAEQGVMVNFVKSGTKIGFEINIDAADKTGIKFSSHVLKKAQLVGSKK